MLLKFSHYNHKDLNKAHYSDPTCAKHDRWIILTISVSVKEQVGNRLSAEPDLFEDDVVAVVTLWLDAEIASDVARVDVVTRPLRVVEVTPERWIKRWKKKFGNKGSLINSVTQILTLFNPNPSVFCTVGLNYKHLNNELLFVWFSDVRYSNDSPVFRPQFKYWFSIQMMVWKQD